MLQSMGSQSVMAQVMNYHKWPKSATKAIPRDLTDGLPPTTFDWALSTVGNRASSAMAEGGLTARQTSRTGAKAGHSDPAVPHGRAVAQRIKGTPGITG